MPISAKVRVARARPNVASHDSGPVGRAAAVASSIHRRPSRLKPRQAQNSLAVMLSSRARTGSSRKMVREQEPQVRVLVLDGVEQRHDVGESRIRCELSEDGLHRARAPVDGELALAGRLRCEGLADRVEALISHPVQSGAGVEHVDPRQLSQ